MFVYTRLPAPPGRVLVPDGSALGLHLSSLGFEIVCTARDGVEDHAPALHGAAPAAIYPFPDAAFDLIVTLDSQDAPWEEWHRLLAPGGRVIGTSQGACSVGLGFRILEERQAVACDGGWALDAQPSAGPTFLLWVAARK